MLLDSREQLTPAARELLEKQVLEIELDIRNIEEAQRLLDEQEENVEKLIEDEFVVLEQGKQAGQKKLEEDWKHLLEIEAANLWFIEQEVVERNDALEEQRRNLESKEAKLNEFQREQSRSLETLVEEKEALSAEREQILAGYRNEMEETEMGIKGITTEIESLTEEYIRDSR
ncbi:putative kinesin-like protein KIF16B [Apostichopus japonicus]|uniref:Putative kinesin-like protein KIF16B n=1 Tax=Stichopus japonicus TaxID=307972 RepID=A0A2G8JSM8_STIJA|nr:putative kinesin-like protein KIF16B [Apostichopus japonicus]